MNIYITDDEFRKQCEGLVGKLVVTGQEAPESNKGFRDDLYKKHVSGDPVACRSNYAIVTKMLSLHGFKRYELNRAISFSGVSEESFPSILRRSLVIQMKARFWSKNDIRHSCPNGDNEAQGVFV